MKDFVYSPQVNFNSYKFMYQKAFFIGTKNKLYICPSEKDAIPNIGGRPGSIFNLIDGKKAEIYLLELVSNPTTDADKIHEVFNELIQRNNADGENNVAYIDLTELKRLRIDNNWMGAGIITGYSTNLLGDKNAITGFGKKYKKDIVEFYKQYYPLNKLLKAEENFQ